MYYRVLKIRVCKFGKCRMNNIFKIVAFIFSGIIAKAVISSIFYIQGVKARAMPCPRHTPIEVGNTISVAKLVLPNLLPPAVFFFRHGIVCASLCDFYETAIKIFNVVLKVFAFDG